jgi:hypothetical protein
MDQPVALLVVEDNPGDVRLSCLGQFVERTMTR